MAKQPPLSDKDREDLVAYLDGELDAKAARDLEARLHLDPGARREAEALKRTWDLLDYLPRPEPSPNFTNKTLERLQPVAARTDRMPRWPSGRRWALGLGWAAAVLLSAAAGYGAVTAWQTRQARDPDHELLRDLRVIENKRFYDPVDDLEFLQQLDQPDLFGEDPSDS